jgi:ribosome-associated toxin RatA of RatAB toxin-antitoxin module
MVQISGLILLSMGWQPPAVAQQDWTADPAVQRRLAGGEVVVQSTGAVDAAHPGARIRAAVRIKAPADAIWEVVTDCKQVVSFVPGLKRCRRIDGAPDGSWADIEHEVRYSWLLPSVDYVFRAHYDRPRRIDFRRISGGIKEVEGAWVLVQTSDAATVAEYEVYLDPGFWIPHVLVTHSLRKDLPAALAGLRDQVEHAGRDDRGR